MKGLLITVLLGVLLSGCVTNTHSEKPYAFTELVMNPGMKITATTASGTIQIYADDELKRTYTWEGVSRSATLWPREERWYGSLGAYYPGPGSHWVSHNGITRGVLSEGQMHFASTKEALEWLNKPWHKTAGSVYRDDGLFVLFSKSPSREQLNVNVFQIYVGGTKPTKLTGSKNDDISILGRK